MSTTRTKNRNYYKISGLRGGFLGGLKSKKTSLTKESDMPAPQAGLKI
jgi:hypothetical protein